MSSNSSTPSPLIVLAGAAAAGIAYFLFSSAYFHSHILFGLMFGVLIWCVIDCAGSNKSSTTPSVAEPPPSLQIAPEPSPVEPQIPVTPIAQVVRCDS
jgi:heme/copper-type cytochrome/quinol oxidase subunit 2